MFDCLKIAKTLEKRQWIFSSLKIPYYIIEEFFIFGFVPF